MEELLLLLNLIVNFPKVQCMNVFERTPVLELSVTPKRTSNQEHILLGPRSRAVWGA